MQLFEKGKACSKNPLFSSVDLGELCWSRVSQQVLGINEILFVKGLQNSDERCGINTK